MWGEEYIEYFERLCLKSLLKNNIDKSKKISFNIYCFKDELHKIKNLKNIKKLKKLILINYYFLEKKRKEKYSYIADYQKKLIDTAKELNNDYFIFCYPDTIFCENYIKLFHLFAQIVFLFGHYLQLLLHYIMSLFQLNRYLTLFLVLLCLVLQLFT